MSTCRFIKIFTILNFHVTLKEGHTESLEFDYWQIFHGTWEWTSVLWNTEEEKANLSPVCLLSRSVMPNSCDPIDCSLPGSSIHGILQVRILGWVAISFFRGSSWPRNWTQVSCIAVRLFTDWAMRDLSPWGINSLRVSVFCIF